MLVCKSSGCILPIAARLSGSCHPSELKKLGQACCKHPQTLFPANRAFSSRGCTQTAASSATLASMGDVFFLDEFASRQWDDPDYSGTSIEGNKQEFVDEVHRQHRHARTISIPMMLAAIEHADSIHAALRHYDMPVMMRLKLTPAQGSKLVDGYAPFCKHIFVRNFVGARLGAMQITDANRHLLQCGYSRRRPEELPVLTRWLVVVAYPVVWLLMREAVIDLHEMCLHLGAAAACGPDVAARIKPYLSRLSACLGQKASAQPGSVLAFHAHAKNVRRL